MESVPISLKQQTHQRPWFANKFSVAGSSFSRIFQYLAATRIIKDYPALGIGPDTIGIVYQKNLAKVFSSIDFKIEIESVDKLSPIINRISELNEKIMNNINKINILFESQKQSLDIHPECKSDYCSCLESNMELKRFYELKSGSISDTITILGT